MTAYLAAAFVGTYCMAFGLWEFFVEQHKDDAIGLGASAFIFVIGAAFATASYELYPM